MTFALPVRLRSRRAVLTLATALAGGALAVLAGASTAAVTCTDEWETAVSGSWAEAGNWADGTVPTSTDVVCITVPGDYTVSLSGSTSVDGLQVGTAGGGQKLAFSSNANGSAVLAIASDVVNDGTLLLDSSYGYSTTLLMRDAGSTYRTLTNNGTLQVLAGSGGHRDIDLSTLVNNGTLEVQSDLRLDQGGATYVNHGLIDVSAGRTLGLAGSAPTFQSHPGSAVVLRPGTAEAADAVMTQDGGVLTYLGGTFTDGSTGADGYVPLPAAKAPALTGLTLDYATTEPAHFRLAATSTLLGDIPADATLHYSSNSSGSGTLTVRHDLINDGTLVLDSSYGYSTTLLMRDAGSTYRTLTNNGTLQVLAGSGGHRDIDLSALVNNGTLDVQSDLDLDQGGATYVNNHVIDVSAGRTVALAGSAPTFRAELDSAVVLRRADGVATGALGQVGGTFVYAGGAFTDGTRDADGNYVRLGPDDIPALTGLTLDYRSGPDVPPADFRLSATVSLLGHIPAGATVHYSSTSSGSSVLTVPADLTNDGTLVLDSQYGYGTTLLLREGASAYKTLTNNGTLRVVAGSGGQRDIDLSSFINRGRLDVQSNLRLDQGGATYDNHGNIDVAAGRTLEVSGSPTFRSHPASTLVLRPAAQEAPDAVMSQDSGTFSYLGGDISDGSTDGNGDHVQLPVARAPALSTLTLDYGTTEPAHFQLSGTATLLGDVPRGATLHHRSTSSGSAVLTVPADLTNSGTLVLDSQYGYDTTLRLRDSASAYKRLTNDGTLQVLPGAGGGRDVDLTQLVNHGVLDIQADLRLDQTGATYTNDGELQVTPDRTVTIANGTLTNYDAATDTLTGGTYVLGGAFPFSGAGPISTLDADVFLTHPGAHLGSTSALDPLSDLRGVLQLSGGRSLTTTSALASTGELFIDSGSVLALGGALTQSGTSSLIDLGGTLVAPGVTLQDGALRGTGTLDAPLTNAGGSIRPGHEGEDGWVPGTLSVGIAGQPRAFSQNADGALVVDVVGGAAGEFSQLAVSGPAQLAGRMDIWTGSDGAPEPGTDYRVLTSSSLPSGTLTATGTRPPGVNAYVVQHDAEGVNLHGATVPTAPTAVVAVHDDKAADLTWSPPSYDGDSPLTGYTVTSSPAGGTAVVSGSTARVTGLTNGQPYTFTVLATNVVGDSPVSLPSNEVTPATVPDPPTSVTASAGNASATVTWLAPQDDGGSDITGYTVSGSPGGTVTVGADQRSALVTGLANGTSYTFTVAATNAEGDSLPSQASSAVTPIAPPAPPTAVTGTRGDRSATLSWNAPTDTGGSAITGYEVTSSPAGGTAVVTGTGAAVTGLTNGTTYTFTVKAVNAAGTSAASAASAPVTPATVPDAPTDVTATAGNATAELTWSAPGEDGGSDVTGYSVTSSPAGARAVVTGTGASITGLTNGTAYTFTVKAVNDVGSSAASAASNTVTSAGPPAAPSGVTGTRGDERVSLSWTAPTDTGGSPITGYRVSSTPPGGTAVIDGTTAMVPNLVNGTAYTFTVVAINAVGTSPASAASQPVTPATVPDAPTDVVATAGNESASLTWTAPGDDGGNPLTGYAVTSNPAGGTAVVDGTTATVTGLTSGTAYTFTVRALNDVGSSAASAPSKAVTPTARPTAPTAPTGVTATAGNAAATLSWTAPASTGGSPVTGYSVTSSPAGGTAVITGTTAAVSGLTNGTAYTFTVKAINAIGSSVASTPSAAVTPTGPPAPPTGVTGTRGDRSAALSWKAPTDTGGSPVTGYRVSSTPAGGTAVITGTTATVPDLVNGTSYTFRVFAVNAVGESVASASSAPVTPAAAPGAPTGVTATAGDGSAALTWTAPSSNGGSPVTSYLVSSSPAGGTAAVTGTTATVTGLTNGTAYTFTVKAVNAVGSSVASAPSAAVTPAAPVDPGPGATETTVVEPVPAGGTTATAGDAASPSNPVITAVTSPQGGDVSVVERPAGADPAAPGYRLLGQSVVITAPEGTVDAPLRLVFRVDASQLPAGENVGTVTVQRNSVPVARACSGSNAAEPDPCMLSRTLDGDDVVLTVLTSRASTWTFATPVAGSVDALCKERLGGARFPDVPAGTVHADAVQCLSALAITHGDGRGGYGPAGAVTRAQMATFLHRLVLEAGGALPAPGAARFTDVQGTHATAIETLAAAGVIRGVTDSTYAPGAPMSRAQMASLLDRTYRLLDGAHGGGSADAFTDDQGSTHEAAINRMAAAGVAGGVEPGRFQPAGDVRRDQMASFLTRLLNRLVAEGTVTTS